MAIYSPYPLLLLLLLTLPVFADNSWFERHDSIMGTAIDIKLQHSDAQQAQWLLDHSMALFRQLDQQMSHYKADSELSRINQLAFKQPVHIHANLFGLIQQAQALSALSAGAFDITYASVGYLYDYRAGQVPDQASIDARLAAIDYRSVVLDKQQQTVRFLHNNTRIDLGGIGKGYAVDQVVALLQQHKVSAAMVTAGGDTRIIGHKTGQPWVVGIKNPRNTAESALLLPLDEAMAISTSGDYERFFLDAEQQRHHHIINPQTGKNPLHDIQSVTILGPDATTTDGLSTTVFVLGPDAGMALVNRLDGIEAIIIRTGGRLQFSDGLQQLR